MTADIAFLKNIFYEKIIRLSFIFTKQSLRPSVESPGPVHKVSLLTRAIPTLEGKDARLIESASSRDYAIDLCYKSAKARGYYIFAIQNGICFGMRGSTRYKNMGKSQRAKMGKVDPGLVEIPIRNLEILYAFGRNPLKKREISYV